jgi:imidazolonepropionase-like amidohydrolase
MFRHVLSLATLLLTGLPASADLVTFQHVTLINGRGGAPQPDMTVVVDDTHIAEVRATAAAGKPRGTVIDGHGRWLMPGIMDVHVHLRGDQPGVALDGRHKIDPAAIESSLAGFLYEGVTTIADMGNQPENILPERQRERDGTLLAPHIFAAGNLVTYPGSKSAEMAILVSDFARDKPLLDKHIAEQKPDYVKLTYDTGGTMLKPNDALLPLPLMHDIVEYYNLHGLRAIVHVITERRAIEAIYAGVDALAHPVMDAPGSESFVKLMAAKKIPFATTLTIGDNYQRLTQHPEFLDRPDYAAVLSLRARETLRGDIRGRYLGPGLAISEWRTKMMPVCEENIRRIVTAGGIAALGTDQDSGAATHREMELLVQAGLTPAQVIKIATYNSAVFLGKADSLGSVEPGKLADLLLLSADPTQDIDNTNALVLVMKNGAIIDESRLMLGGGPKPKRFVR